MSKKQKRSKKPRVTVDALLKTLDAMHSAHQALVGEYRALEINQSERLAVEERKSEAFSTGLQSLMKRIAETESLSRSAYTAAQSLPDRVQALEQRIAPIERDQKQAATLRTQPVIPPPPPKLPTARFEPTQDVSDEAAFDQLCRIVTAAKGNKTNGLIQFLEALKRPGSEKVLHAAFVVAFNRIETYGSADA